MVLTLKYVGSKDSGKRQRYDAYGYAGVDGQGGGGVPVGLEEVQEIHLPSSLDNSRCDTI